MGGCGAESREGAVWGEGDRDQGGDGCVVVPAPGVSRPTEARRRVRARDVHEPDNSLLPVRSFFLFCFRFFFSRTVFFLPRTGVFFSRKAARCERCSPWKKRKYLGVHVRRIRSCSFWTFFYCFFSFQKKLTAGNRKGRTGKPHHARSGTTGYGGSR
jgi:hypothetical protein